MKPVKKQPNRWLLFSPLAIQMGVLFYGAARLGNHLDAYFQTDNTASLFTSLGALIVSLVLIVQQTKNL